ncbi:MAG: hypothetical protein ACOCVC_06225 [Spirochaeta sp.]
MRELKRFFVIMLFGALALPAFAQWEQSGSLTVQGNMPLIVELQIEDANTTLQLEEAATDVLIATVRERSNSTSGYTLSLTSANAGELADDTGDSSLAYTLSYGGTEVDLTSGTIVANSSTSRTPAQGVEQEVLVSHGSGDADGDFLPEGQYTDTLTFEITAQ